MIITFIGSDGSGKTTIANQIGAPVVHHYNNPIHRRIKRKKDKKVTPRPTLARKIWPIFMYFFFLYRYLRDRLRSDTIVYDRYVFDSYVGWLQQGRITPLARWLYMRFPLPDEIYLVDAEPKVLMARKPDDYLNLEQCTKKRGMYLGVATARGIPIYDNNG